MGIHGSRRWYRHLERLAGTALSCCVAPKGLGSPMSVRSSAGPGRATLSKVSKPEELTGRFNSHHQGKLLLQVGRGFFRREPGGRGRPEAHDHV